MVPLALAAADFPRGGCGSELPALRARYGGKALGLMALLSVGLPVPEAVLLDDKVWRQAIAFDPELTSLPTTACSAVQDAWEHMRRGGHRLLAVRSSASVEDRDGASFAGQAETVLGVSSLPALRDAVLRCYRSAGGARAKAYLSAMGGGASAPAGPDDEPLDGPSMPLIIQAQIRPSVAGVLFTADTRGGGEPAILVNASYGSGEPLVSGLVSPDTFALAPLPAGPVLRGRRLGDKATAVHFGPLGERTSVPVPGHMRRRFCMGDDELIQLAAGASRLAAALGQAQDIEFAVSGRRVWFLQSRPLTGLVAAAAGSGPAGAVMGNAGGLPDAWGYNDSLSGDYLWTNGNVGEGLPGVLTPFSWGLVRVFFDMAARQVFGVLAEGVPLFGNIYGRLYLNLSGRASVARALAWVLPGPLFERLAKLAWGDIWGLVPDGMGLPLVAVSPVSVYTRLPRSAFLFARALWRHQTRFRRFRDRSLPEVAMLRRRLADDCAARDPARLEARWAGEIQPQILMAGTMVMFTAAATAASQKQLGLSRPVLKYGDETSMARIMAGVGGLESVAPTLELWQLSRLAAALPGLPELLRDGEQDNRLVDPEFRERVRGIAGGELFVDALEHFLERHGHRSETEFESASPGWAEDPSPVLAALRLYLDLPESSGPAAAQAARVSEARAELARISRRAGSRTGLIARQMVRLHHANLLRREEARSLLVLWASLGRTFALAAGRVLVEVGCLVRVEQVFQLELSEVLAALRSAGEPGEPGAAGWADVAARREERYRFYGQLPDPPSVFRGPVVAAELGGRETGQGGRHTARSASRSRDSAGRTLLRGLPASPGRVRGLVRRLDSPRQAGLVRQGDVLVTRSANVGWTIIFQTLSAVVTDVGAPFSHAAIVIRELHRAAVVDTKFATAVLRDGDFVQVDGDRGLITRLLRRRLVRARGTASGRLERAARFGRSRPVRRGGDGFAGPGGRGVI